MTESDEQLFQSYLSGDQRAFERLLERYRGPLFMVILRMVNNMADAEDIFQETFVRVVDKRDRFRTDARFSSWVYTIATNLCRDLIRRRKKSPLRPAADDFDPPGGPSPETRSWQKEIKTAVEAAIDRLGPEQKEVFLLRHYGGLSFKEIAAVTDTKLNTVLGRMHLAVARLKKDLAELMEEPA